VTQKTTDWERGGGEGRFEGRKMREMMRARWLAIKSQTLRQEKGKGGGGGKGGGNRTDASPSDEERMLTFLRVGKVGSGSLTHPPTFFPLSLLRFPRFSLSLLFWTSSFVLFLPP
jgi:hypothetical protein